MRFDYCITFCCLVVVGSAAPAQRSDVLPPVQRNRTIELATQLTEPAQPTDLPAGLRNPFTTADAPVVATVTAQAAPTVVSDRQLLQSIAPLVNPSGTVMLGGDPILLFGQKRIKVGDTLSISFDGRPYELVISNIQSTSFTLRLRGEELTRPIKPANRP